MEKKKGLDVGGNPRVQNMNNQQIIKRRTGQGGDEEEKTQFF